MRHGVPEIVLNDDLNFSATVHSDKQTSRQISTIVFSNARPGFIVHFERCFQFFVCNFVLIRIGHQQPLYQWKFFEIF